jgi:hypothetical protein
MDPAGFISYTQYDPLTGAVVEQIQDVSTSDTGDFSNKPSDWTTLSGAGLNLVTSYEVDSLGRVTEQTNPNGTVDYYVYIREYMEAGYARQKRTNSCRRKAQTPRTAAQLR